MINYEIHPLISSVILLVFLKGKLPETSDTNKFVTIVS